MGCVKHLSEVEGDISIELTWSREKSIDRLIFSVHQLIFSVHWLCIKLMIGGNSFSVETIIFQCIKQSNHSRVNPESPKWTWNILKGSSYSCIIFSQSSTADNFFGKMFVQTIYFSCSPCAGIFLRNRVPPLTLPVQRYLVPTPSTKGGGGLSRPPPLWSRKQ